MDTDAQAASAPARAECRNCGAASHGEYCCVCGQRAFDPRRPLLQLVREFLVETFELDGRLARTLVPFLCRPGFLTREFREGRRARYSSPLRLYIATSLLCFSLLAIRGCVTEPFEGSGPMLTRSDVVDGKVVPQEIDAELDEVDTVVGDAFRLVRDKSRKFAQMPISEQRRRAYAGITSNLAKFLVVMVPLFALLLRALIRSRRGFLYFDHLVFALHVHSFWFVTLAMRVVVPSFLDWVVAVGAVVYAVIALRRAYALSWPATLWRSFVLGATYGAMVVAAILAALFTAILDA